MSPLGTTVALSAELDEKLELEAIYREHSAAISKWIRRMWGPASGRALGDEEDLLHEVFLVVQRRLSSFRAESALSTWLYSITVLVVNARRKKERWRSLLWKRAEHELQMTHAPPAQERFGPSEASRVVYSVLDELRERDRTLLILFELEQLPGSEIASILGISEANVWVALTRARGRFKKIFERRYGDAVAAEGASHGPL